MNKQVLENEYLNIYAASLSNRKLNQVFTSFNGDNFIIIFVQQISGEYSQLKKRLCEEIQIRKKEDFMCIVESNDDFLPIGVHRVNLNDIDLISKSTLYKIVLDQYLYLIDRNKIFFGAKVERFRIRQFSDLHFHKKKSEKNSSGTYPSTVWDNIKIGQRVVLLSLIGMVIESRIYRQLEKVLNVRLSTEQENVLRGYNYRYPLMQ